MALERPPYFLHFLQSDEVMPTRGSTDDWGETNLWKAKQAGLRFNSELAPDQLKWIERYAANQNVSWDEARAVARQQQVQADCRVERIFEAVRRGLSEGLVEPLPSRQRCSMYVFDASLDITAYASVMKIPLDRTLVKIAPMEGARWHRVRMSLLGVVGKDDDTIAATAEQYWAGLAEPELDSEVLLSGPFDVLGVETLGSEALCCRSSGQFRTALSLVPAVGVCCRSDFHRRLDGGRHGQRFVKTIRREASAARPIDRRDRSTRAWRYDPQPAAAADLTRPDHPRTIRGSLVGVCVAEPANDQLDADEGELEQRQRFRHFLLDYGYEPGEKFCRELLSSGEFSPALLGRFCQVGFKSLPKEQVAGHVAARLMNGEISADDLMLAFCQQPRDWRACDSATR